LGANCDELAPAHDVPQRTHGLPPPVSAVDTWEAATAAPGFHIHGELVLAVPNDARAPLVNPVGDAVVMTLRGNASFVDKALHCQQASAEERALPKLDDEVATRINRRQCLHSPPPARRCACLTTSYTFPQAGARAVVIADDGSCSDDFRCGGWLGARDHHNDGDAWGGAARRPLAASDGRRPWAGVRVPVVLITARSAERLLQQLELESVELDDGSLQRYVR
jgi:hypothetical protein